MIKIKYFNKDYPRLKTIKQGNWIDLHIDSVKSPETTDRTLKYKKGDVLFLGLGVAMELPKGYEAYIAPRSSTFKKTGLLLTNGIGIIDNVYKGDTDEWKVMLYATRDGEIKRHDKLFQFRVQKIQPNLELREVKQLGNKDRGGYGSTDKEE